MFRFAQRVSTRLSFVSSNAFGFAPLATGLSARDGSLEPVMFVSGMAVLTAGLVVLRAAQTVALKTAVAPVRADMRMPQSAGVHRYTAEEVLAQREIRLGDREMLLNALATAAETFYSIAGHLPREASDRALGKADDLRELVWLNRAKS